MQPPGGHSSISIGDGSGYSAYSRYGAYQPVSSAPSNSPYSGGGQYGGAAAYQSSAAAYSVGIKCAYGQRPIVHLQRIAVQYPKQHISCA